MPNNTTLPGTGNTIVTEDIGGGVQLQVVKVATGEQGINTPVTTNNPMPVGGSFLSSINDAVQLLRRMFLLMKPLGVVTGSGSNRLSVDVNNIVGGTIGTVSNIVGGTITTVTGVTTVTTVTGVTTVSTLTNAANIGSIPGFDLMKAMSRAAYNTGIRSNIV